MRSESARVCGQTRRGGIEARRREADGRLAAIDGQLETARQGREVRLGSGEHLRSSLSTLRSLKEEHRGVSSGAKALLEARLPGIRGALASMLRVPEEYLVAVSAALGGAQSYLVSQGFGRWA